MGFSLDPRKALTSLTSGTLGGNYSRNQAQDATLFGNEVNRTAGGTGAVCAKRTQEIKTNSEYRKGFLDNIAGLDFIGKTQIGKGLQTLTKVSNMIRVGGTSTDSDPDTQSAFSSIANTAVDNITAGGAAVIETVGLTDAVNSVASFNPRAVNSAVSSAQGIYSKVKGGNLTLDDIPSLYSQFSTLSNLFGSAVDTAPPATKHVNICGASPYATDLLIHAPKYNFMFIVDVEFSSEYREWNDIGKGMAFAIKRSTRPQIEYEYEDINMYNFKTRVAKKATYPPMTMAFYDDNQNNAHLFYTAHMRAMSPITNMKQNGLEETKWHDERGMNFTNPTNITTFSAHKHVTKGYSASLGPLNNNTKNLIKRIRLYHVFDYGRLMNVYNFYNPKITNFNPSELNMAETGDGAEFEFQFVYDGMHIEESYSVQAGLAGGGEYNLKYLTSRPGTIYPLNPIFGDNDKSSNTSTKDQVIEANNEPGLLDKVGDFANNVTSGIEGAINDGWAAAEKGLSYAGGLVSNGLAEAGNLITGGADGDRSTSAASERAKNQLANDTASETGSVA